MGKFYPYSCLESIHKHSAKVYGTLQMTSDLYSFERKLKVNKNVLLSYWIGGCVSYPGQILTLDEL